MVGVADFDVADFENPEDTKGVYARFYVVPKEDAAASLHEGRPVYKDVVYIEIVSAGNSTNIIRRPVTDMDRRRFRKQHEMFLAGSEDQLVGTPLVEVPWITRSQVEELHYLKVRTLENLASLNDAVCTNIPGMFELKRKAAAYIAKASADAPFEEMRAENDLLKERLAALEAAMSASAEGKKK